MLFVALFLLFLLTLFLAFTVAGAAIGEVSLNEMGEIVFPLYCECDSQATTYHGSNKRKHTAQYAGQIGQWDSDQERNDEANNESDDSRDQVTGGSFTHPAVWYNGDIGSEDEGQQSSQFQQSTKY